MQGKIVKVSGPLVETDNMEDVKMYDVVKVGEKELIGEVIELRGDRASIQVYEETAGLKVGEPTVSTKMPLSVELGPGLIGNVFDGIGRSLSSIYDLTGDRITAGVNAIMLDHEKKWKFTPTLKVGEEVFVGDIVGEVQESGLVSHKIMVQEGFEGKITKIAEGEFNLEDAICEVLTADGKKEMTMLTKWPVRKGRPYKQKLTLSEPLITGQRVIDTFFPLAKGGVACVPGPFGSGKTVVQHQLAKWSEAEIVVYIGCGERGNEMTDVLNEFPSLVDPKTGRGLMERTILVANTSDMPVSAREASIYTGITIAEYYRDMGYNVVIMADSTSRWAEALREMSGRLEEMPGEEGYPAYLGTRIAEFYERAGKVELLSKKERREGSISAIGAVSPQGGDLSEPVSQNTLRVVKVFWGLSSSLAYKRHFPAIDWLTSYSNYNNTLNRWYSNNVSAEFNAFKSYCMKLLQEEASLNEIVQLVGFDVLGDKDKITLDIAEIIREDYLHQNAFDEIDTYTSLKKQEAMLDLIISYSELAYDAVKRGMSYTDIIALPSRAKIGRVKYTKEKDLDDIKTLKEDLKKEFDKLLSGRASE